MPADSAETCGRVAEGIAVGLSSPAHDWRRIVGDMTTRPPRSTPEPAPVVPVEVRARFDGRWGSGFELVEIVDSGAGIRFRVRRAGGEVLPVLFPGEDVRVPNATMADALLRVPVISDP